ncbi:acyl-CoA synthetase [Smaragdicoccus niigatensis]|uniref:acyl-CoA synthetase n=1 Tax=Smaragdicoccus niigatensis TaxID=359359 RepID=UPI000371C948|nr:acyl-CoA synthetase [Smaragdicoccus niigatensis]
MTKALLSRAARTVNRVVDEATYAKLAAEAGLLTPQRPDKLVRMIAAVRRSGVIGAIPTIGAIRYGDRAAIIDELGTVTFRELDDRTNAIANAWRSNGFQPGEGVAVLARNHRGFHYAVFAAAKCGARIVLLNTDFAGPQLREVAAREGADLLVFDDEYSDILVGVETRRGRFRAWTDTPCEDSLAALIASGSSAAPPPATMEPKLILLTSGTSGTPKGAPRSEPKSLAPFGAVLSKVPFRTEEVTECPAPLFHTLGFAHVMLAAILGSTLVIRRRFDPQQTLDSLSEHGATAMVLVPVMLGRIVDLGPDARAGRDLSRLRIVWAAGSHLGADLCKRATDALGPVVYNMYGSTEVGYATIATPADLAAEPSCVGGVVRSAVVKIYDDSGKEVPPGAIGRIFVGNSLQFEGYTGGGDKDRINGLMASGDVGHFDSAGRLFIDGRDDDMIVSGGENVFPGEVEELLAALPSIEEVSAFGVDDEQYGQRLRVVVVVRNGHAVTAADVKDHVKSNLARYKVPRDVLFIDKLPRNPTGKVLKRELRRL